MKGKFEGFTQRWLWTLCAQQSQELRAPVLQAIIQALQIGQQLEDHLQTLPQVRIG